MVDVADQEVLWQIGACTVANETNQQVLAATIRGHCINQEVVWGSIAKCVEVSRVYGLASMRAMLYATFFATSSKTIGHWGQARPTIDLEIRYKLSIMPR